MRPHENEDLPTLGQTTYSRVVKKQDADGLFRAIKICWRPDMKTAAAAWKTEAKILKMLDHVSPIIPTSSPLLTSFKDSIVRLFEFHATNLTLELEFIPGRSLAQQRDENEMCTLDEDVMHDVFTEMSDALTYIHDQGILHGGVKPANIIVRPNRTGVVLCDFGNASIDELVKYSGGTPCYIPPEAFC